jgi:D-alanyl-D-alanine-carboxypeptidase/D-alanyl-D-alanine-endopeptidase
MRNLVALAFVALASPVCRAADVKETIAPPVERFLKDRKNAGFVVGVRQNGQSTIVGYGTVFLRTGEQTPNAESMFEIGSISKGFTGLLLAEAVRRGEVKLDAPAQDYLPPDLVLPKPEERSITFENLATHHSGLAVQPPLIGLAAKDPSNPYADFDRAKLAAQLPKLKLVQKPDEKYLYSNLGAGLVGHALVHSAKTERFDDLLQTRICKPLGLKNTAEALDGAQRARFARAHKANGDATSHWEFATLSACGGIRSCTSDMLRFAVAALGETKTELGPAFKEAFQPRKKLDDNTSIWLYWMASKRSGQTMIWHNGSTFGHRSILILVPDKKTAVVVLSAVAAPEVDKLGMELIELLSPKEK